MTQSQALDILKTGNSVFLTGEPGAGKTYTINRYVQYLRSKDVSVAITASTGIAATHVGGMTIHSWCGIGINKMLSKEELREIARNARVVNRMLKVSVLIIDEISMLDGHTFDLIELVCRTVRKKDEPFGGMQVVCVGDFFQLPPVSKYGEPEPVFAFQSRAWEMMDPRVCYLTEHHRQDDKEFLEVLRSMRAGYLSDENRNVLLSRSVDTNFDHADLDVPKLFTHNMNVDRLNDYELNRISGTRHTFEMKSHGAPPLVDQLKRGCLSPEFLHLKRGAQVMFTKNSFTENYVNGTVGVVTGFVGEFKYPVVQLKNGKTIDVVPVSWSIRAEDKELASIIQLPLRLAWAMTVHKSQGMTIDEAFVDLSNAFVCGQGYVALSRVRSLNGLHLGGLNAQALEVNQDVLMKDAEFRTHSQDAEELLELLTSEDLKTRHDRFVRDCDGNVNGRISEKAERPDKTEREEKKRKLKSKREMKIPTNEQTLALVRIGMNLDQIVEMRGIKIGTVLNHLEQMLEDKMYSRYEIEHLKKANLKSIEKIVKVFEELESHHLQPVFDRFKGKHSFETIRLARLFWKK